MDNLGQEVGIKNLVAAGGGSFGDADRAGANGGAASGHEAEPVGPHPGALRARLAVPWEDSDALWDALVEF